MNEAGTVGDWLRWARGQLAASSDSARLDAELLVAFATGLSRSSVMAFPERRAEPAAAARLRELTRRRVSGVPLAYLVGEKSFYSVTLEVGPGVLVPRAETEMLVDAALAHLAGRAAPSVLDLGSGSGAMALAIKQEYPAASVTGADWSRAALARAARNARRLSLDVDWVVSDWWSAFGERRFDLVVCNPPYVPSADPHFESALRHEPREALDGGDDGLDAIRAVLAGAAEALAGGGLLLLEHGYDQRAAVAALAARCGLAVCGQSDDLAGLPRMLELRVS